MVPLSCLCHEIHRTHVLLRGNPDNRFGGFVRARLDEFSPNAVLGQHRMHAFGPSRPLGSAWFAHRGSWALGVGSRELTLVYPRRLTSVAGVSPGLTTVARRRRDPSTSSGQAGEADAVSGSRQIGPRAHDRSGSETSKTLDIQHHRSISGPPERQVFTLPNRVRPDANHRLVHRPVRASEPWA